MGAAGGAMGGWFRKEIKEISDFKNLKIRMSGSHAKIYGKLGAKKHWMVASEASDAFEKKEIDAIVCQGPFHDQRHRFHKVAQYYYYPGWQEPGAILALIINKKALESLPPHLRKIMEIVRGSIDRYIYNQFISADALALQELKNQGVKILKFPQPVLDRLRQLSTELMEEEAKKNGQFKRVYDAFKTFKEHNKEFQWIKILNEAVRE
jgi:TRAP-type mannitol/chloroaromatic compound transport system substrate-binding protein